MLTSLRPEKPELISRIRLGKKLEAEDESSADNSDQSAVREIRHH
jgi:hypothetical protein